VADADDLRRLLAARGGDAAARLIAEARAEAEARVRSALADAYTDVLLDQVRALNAPETAAPAAAPEPAAPAAPAELGWYVYCVVSGDHEPLPDGLEGIDPGHPVCALEQGELAAVVSRVPLDEFGEEPLRQHLSDMEWLERTARRHEQVQEAVARSGTPIPMRLCSIYREESGVRGMLTREGGALGQALAHLRGKAEWGVKAFAGVDTAESAPPASESATGSGDGAAYMENRLRQRRRRENAAARLDAACDSVHAALGAVAADGVMLSPHRPEMSGRDEPMILNASYLVVEADASAFHAEFDRLRRELGPLGIELQRTGPWPPYNFVPGTIGAAW
jgi:hypothetical protein